ncbi:hypothetical protein [Kutzneria buriramensis]|uniref:Uncharacterized protein n=1 Tax=Kutzneria buriramensis TaxID=1045776 RepID=A0A3E0GW16_9PSEU|nr:hypothetical protein [Kutzneria buriramensis]REH28459.1 hypothetical protein BCF44_12739 [Kutzneria buriramensis]
MTTNDVHEGITDDLLDPLTDCVEPGETYWARPERSTPGRWTWAEYCA